MKREIFTICLVILFYWTSSKVAYAAFTSQARINAISFTMAAVAEPMLLIEGQPVTEQFTSLNFDSSRSGWATIGNVNWLSNEDGLSQAPDIKYVRLQSQQSNMPANVSYDFDAALPDHHARFFTFWYLLDAQESLQGFDEPSFQVWINGQSVFIFNWNQIRAQNRKEDGTLSSNWQQVVINTQDINEIQKIQFSVQTTGDSDGPITVYLAGDTQSAGVITPGTVLRFVDPNSQLMTLSYQTSQGSTEKVVASNTDFTIASDLANFTLTAKTLNKSEGKTYVLLNFLGKSPSIIMKEFTLSPDQSATFLIQSFSTLDLDTWPFQVNYQYQVKTASVPLTAENWNESTLENNEDFSSWVESESIIDSVTLSHFDTNARWIGIRCRNALGQLSNIITIPML